MSFSIGIYSFPMDPMDSIGTTFYPSSNTEWNFPKSLTNRRNELFHWNLFVSNGSPTLGRTFHHYTSGFPMESKGIRLESIVNGYWTTFRKFEKEEALQKVAKRPLKEPESRLFYLHFISMKEIPQISRIKNSSRYL